MKLWHTSHPDTESIVRENERLRRAVDELAILNDLAREIGASHDLEKIIRTVVHRAVRAVGAEQGVVSLTRPETGESAQTLVRTIVSSGDGHPLRPDQLLLGWMQQNGKPLLIDDPANDVRFRGVRWDASVQGVLSVPLFVRSRLIGILTVYNKRPTGSFTEEDARLLTIVAAQSAQVIENARLYEDEKALRRVEEELRLAYDIQTSLLPDSTPAVPGYDIAARTLPARAVGGDFFDFIRLEEGRVGCCVADVTGKGLPAALLMANVQATLRGQAPWTDSVTACVERTNRLLCQRMRKGTFVTMFYAELDPSRHTLTFVNAGHNRPLLHKGQTQWSELHGAGIMLGFKDEFPFQSHVVGLDPGDSIFIYSDGITEAMNLAHEQYGAERLVQILEGIGTEPARSIVDRVIDAVKTHAGKAEQSDDITALSIKRLE